MKSVKLIGILLAVAGLGYYSYRANTKSAQSVAGPKADTGCWKHKVARRQRDDDRLHVLHHAASLDLV